MEYLAHSARNGAAAQPYAEHAENVREKACRAAAEAERFSPDQNETFLEDVVEAAAEYHDLGKLDEKNQADLHRADGPPHLTVNHVDAGTACLLARGEFPAAAVVYAHHRGLPDFVQERLRETARFRDTNESIRKRTDAELDGLLRLHRRLVPPEKQAAAKKPLPADPAVFLRLALSCVADADYGDTASTNPDAPAEPLWPDLQPHKRLQALDRYVAGLSDGSTRGRLRGELYETCKNAAPEGGFSFCSAPVGSGKTTAAMAYLLHTAAKRHLRRIFVILPYTNIISQSVQIYREALTLPGEDPTRVVAELHHRADFAEESLRKYTALWRAPIIVTTAVAFFETLASNQPATLRRLHELPGSAILIDEAHAALPLQLFPLAWHWMAAFARDWGCHWLLASGSLVRFWEIPNFLTKNEAVPVRDLLPAAVSRDLLGYEKRRIAFRWEPAAKSRRELVEWVASAPGPRLLILNTVQSAAVLANDFRKRYGRNAVEHLSTALTPADREKTLLRIQKRLRDPTDTNWVLVATSCVEAGMNFSFRTGFRECASLLSLLQTAGRTDRDGLWPDAEIWTFMLQSDRMLTRNPELAIPAGILKRYFQKGTPIAPELSTQAIRKELQQKNVSEISKKLKGKEDNLQFQEIADDFVVIDRKTATLLVDPKLAESVRNGVGDWKALQRHSVSVPYEKVNAYALETLGDGLFLWNRAYDSFLGYMAGVLPPEETI